MGASNICQHARSVRVRIKCSFLLGKEVHNVLNALNSNYICVNGTISCDCLLYRMLKLKGSVILFPMTCLRNFNSVQML